MSEIYLQEADPSDASNLSELAYEVWRECYSGVVPEAQTEYMLEKFQSPSAIYKQITEEDYRYFIFLYDGQRAGYAAVRKDPDCLFLSKLYVLENFRKRGIASYAVREISKIGKPIRLTVNKGNVRAIESYYKMGFIKVKEQVADIGDGFVMDDYVMELR